MSAPLLQTKLYVPPPRPAQSMVPRPRLVERLEEGRCRECRLTLISAPAGFGKTTLLSEWIASSKPRVRVAWVSLDPHDNDPARFWSYLIAATQTAFPGLGVAVLEALQAPQPPPIEALLTDLINEIAEKALEGAPAHAAQEAASGSVLNLTEDERRHIAGNVCALRAYEAHFDGQFERAVQMAQQAISLLPAKDTISGSSTLVLGDAYLSLGDLQLAVHAYRETKRIALHNGNHSLTVMAVCRVAEALMKQARLYEAFGVFQEAVQLATHPSERQLLSAGYPKIQMSLLLCEWNRLEQASACLKDGMEQCAKWGPVDMRMSSATSLAELQLAQGNTEGALNTLQKLQALLQEEAANPSVVSTLDSLRVRLWLARNNVDAATRWVEDNRAKFQGQISRRCLSDHINLVRVLHAQGVRDPSGPYLEQALQRLTLLVEEAEAAGWNHDAICILVRQALVLHARGDAKGALAALARALHLAEPGGYIRTFIGEGEPMGRLLRQVAARGVEPAYVGRLLAALEPESGRRVRLTPAPLIEPLSERESEVLPLLRTDLSSTGIAQVLHISVNAVRSHQKNIYGNLNVHSRFEAITRAEELGLL